MILALFIIATILAGVGAIVCLMDRAVSMFLVCASLCAGWWALALAHRGAG